MTAPSKGRMRRCHEGKQQFATLKDAQAAANGMTRRKAAAGAGKAIVSWVRAYGCACGGFHIGKTREINWALVAELSIPKKVA
jgi:hypothetical protein